MEQTSDDDGIDFGAVMSKPYFESSFQQLFPFATTPPPIVRLVGLILKTSVVRSSGRAACSSYIFRSEGEGEREREHADDTTRLPASLRQLGNQTTPESLVANRLKTLNRNTLANRFEGPLRSEIQTTDSQRWGKSGE